MLTAFSNDAGEFTRELGDNAEDIERREVRMTGERRATMKLDILELTFICSYACSGLIHRLELPCGPIHPRDLDGNKRTEERYEDFQGVFSTTCANLQLKVRGGVLEVRMAF